MTHPSLEISEKAFQDLFNQAARVAGWKTYHTYRSTRSEPGFPDVFAVHPLTGETFFAELKTTKGKLSAAQKLWIEAIKASGIPVFVFRPADWPLIEEVLTGVK